MDKKISQLDAVTTLNNNDVLPIVNGGVTKKVSVSQLIQVGGSTNLTYTASPTNGIVNSDTGTDATLPLADGTNAGLFTPAEKTKLSGIQAGANLVTQTNQLTNNGADGVNNFITTLNIQDNITNGITGKAPSQNAVFDALALKQNILGYTPYRFVQTSNTSNTGTTTEQIAFTTTITPNTFASNDIIKILFGANKISATAGYTLRLKVNTLNTLDGATTIATYIGTSTIFTAIMQRNFHLVVGNLNGTNFTSSTISDVLQGSNILNSTAINPANQFFIFATIQLVNATEDMKANMISITN